MDIISSFAYAIIKGRIIMTEIIGFAAAILTMFSLLPQVIKTWKTKSTKDISLPTFLTSFLGTLLWLLYGILTKQFSIIMANAVVCSSAFVILILKIKNG